MATGQSGPGQPDYTTGKHTVVSFKIRVGIVVLFTLEILCTLEILFTLEIRGQYYKHATYDRQCVQRTLTSLRGSINVQLTSCFICLHSATLLMSNEQPFYLLGKIQISQKGSQPYSDTSPYGECSLMRRLPECL